MIKKLYSIYKRLFWDCEKYARHIGVKIGKDCLISTRNFSSEPYLIEIGDNVRIASDVKFFTHGGLIPFRRIMNSNLDIFGKIKIGNNVHIGDSAFIMPGVTIGDNSIIAAGSVVTKSMPDGKIIAGNPARIVGETKDFLKRAKLMDVGSKGMSYEEKKKFLLSLSDEKFISK